jgi:hypothetical protein
MWRGGLRSVCYTVAHTQHPAQHYHFANFHIFIRIFLWERGLNFKIIVCIEIPCKINNIFNILQDALLINYQ